MNPVCQGGIMKYLAIDILVVMMMFLVSYAIYLRFHVG